MDDLEKIKFTYFKRRFRDTYNYVTRSVKRGSAYPVPVCFIKETNEDGCVTIKLPFYFEYWYDKICEDQDGAKVLQWLVSFDIAPFEQYEEMFVEAETQGYNVEESDRYDFITGIGDVTEKLKDLHALWDEELHNRMIARNDVTTDAVKEFAGTFMDGGETPENVERAQTILAHMKTLGQTQIARYLGGREDIIAKPRTALHRWLKAHGYNVGSPQGFNAAFPDKKKVAKITINKQVL